MFPREFKNWKYKMKVGTTINLCDQRLALLLLSLLLLLLLLCYAKKNVFSLDSNNVTESLLRTVCGSEFQTAGAEHRKARFANVVVVDG